MDSACFDRIITYLHTSEMPMDLQGEDLRYFRKKTERFCAEDGKLMYRVGNRLVQVVRDVDMKSLIESVHGPEHLGINAVAKSVISVQFNFFYSFPVIESEVWVAEDVRSLQIVVVVLWMAILGNYDTK